MFRKDGGFVLPPLLAMFSIYGYIYTVVRKQIHKINTLQFAIIPVRLHWSALSPREWKTRRWEMEPRYVWRNWSLHG